MRFPSILCLLAISTWVSAAESLGIWEFGQGTIASAPAMEGAEILPGIPVTAGDQIVRLSLTRAPKSQIMLSPNSTIRLIEEGDSLMVFIDSGVIQGNIADKGPYTDMHIIGAAIDIRITGTLFVVERVKADTDYVALVEGKIQVNLRKDVAKALGAENKSGVDIAARQGIGGSTSGGLTKVDTLNSRPQLPTSASRSTSVRDDAMDGSGGWAEDTAIQVTTTDEMQSSVVNDISTQIADQISQQITDDVTTQVTNEVILEVIGGQSVNAELGTPPGPPQ